MPDVFFVANRNLVTSDPVDFGAVQPVDHPRCGRATVDVTDQTSQANSLAAGAIAALALYPDPPGAAASIIGIETLLADAAAAARAAARDILVYLHGFDTDFRSALFFGAQYAYNMAQRRERLVAGDATLDATLAKTPIVLMFSWPSLGQVIEDLSPSDAYRSDRDQGKLSAGALADFLGHVGGEFGSRSGGSRVHLVAQSMGNWVLHWGLQALRDPAAFGPVFPRVFEQIFLCGADEDFDALDSDDKLRLAASLGRTVTLYRNTEDGVLELSETYEGNGPRLGRDGPDRPSDLLAVSVVDVTQTIDVNFDTYGHYYDRLNPYVQEDMLRLLGGAAPDQGPLRQVAFGASRYYRLYSPDAVAQYEYNKSLMRQSA